MLRLLADENVPKRLVTLLRREGVEVVRLQDLGLRGISDKSVVDVTNRLGYAILTRDSDYTATYFQEVRQGVVYISYQPIKEEIPELARRIAEISKAREPKPGMLVVLTPHTLEVYE
ncbi:MAG: DUF5615 family PIN-like protein [Candidatus Korarchaeota archaeon]|nr:DUF5615 family PIN-like protein [Candidatus Korarchaeota archaeon]